MDWRVKLKAINEKGYFKTKAAHITAAACFMLAVNHYFFTDAARETATVINIPVMVLAYLFLQRTKNIVDPVRKNALIFSMLFSAMLIVGRQVYDTNDVTQIWAAFPNFAYAVISFFGFSMFFTAFFSYVFKFFIERDSDEKTTELWKIFRIKKVYFVIWLFIFLSWLPAFIAYYPGIFSYDMPYQTWTAFGLVEHTKHHPPLHTFIWSLCLKCQDLIHLEAIVIYTLIQMVLLSAAFAGIIHFLIKKNMKNWIILASLLFLSVNPVVAICSLLPIKDIYFTAFFVLAVVELCKLYMDPDSYFSNLKNYIILGVFVLLSCLFRNNAVYAFILGVPVAAIALKKQWKKVLLIFMLPIVCYYFIDGFVYTSLGIREGEVMEMLCVPQQQIANVAANKGESLTDEEKAAINEYLPCETMAGLYNPRLADPIKGSINQEKVEEDKGKFLKLWMDLFFEYPGEYANAFLTLNLPYWYIDSAAIDPYAEREYIETGIYETDQYTFERKNPLPFLFNFYEKVASYELLAGIPVISLLCSMTFPIWIMLFCIFLLKAKGHRKGMCVLAVPCFFWLTYIAGPVSNFRYIIPLFCLYPLLLAFIFQSGRFFGSVKMKREDLQGETDIGHRG